MLQELEAGVKVLLLPSKEAGEGSEQQLLGRWQSRLQLTQVSQEVANSTSSGPKSLLGLVVICCHYLCCAGVYFWAHAFACVSDCLSATGIVQDPRAHPQLETSCTWSGIQVSLVLQVIIREALFHVMSCKCSVLGSRAIMYCNSLPGQ